MQLLKIFDNQRKALVVSYYHSYLSINLFFLWPTLTRHLFNLPIHDAQNQSQVLQDEQKSFLTF